MASSVTFRFFRRRQTGPQLQANAPTGTDTGVINANAAGETRSFESVEAGHTLEPFRVADKTESDTACSADQEIDTSWSVAELTTLKDAADTHPAIAAALASLQTLRVFVTTDGVVYHVEDPSHVRTIEDLLSLVQQQLGRALAKPISLLQFSQLRSHAVKPRHASTSQNDLVEMVLFDAIEQQASDVYIAIHLDRTVIHFRTHGVRYLHSAISHADGKEMARSLWSLARDGHFEDNVPTDTAFDFANVRVRGNAMPDTRGNSIVLRLRDPTFMPPLKELGYDVRQQRALEELQFSAGGLAIVSGETNSGKSTTLTSLMAGMSDDDMIIELADPIEIEFPHVTHMALDHYAEDAEKLFRSTLGGLVRQNPDTLFIGEVRDQQTATAAIDMALQGKRVWGTVHSHSALTTISRLEHLGIPVHVLGQPGFLNGIVNQSLVPLVCAKCARDSVANDSSEGDVVATTRLQRKYHTDNLRFHNPDGCSACVRGISGQTVVAEVMQFPREPDHPAQQCIRNHDLAGLAVCMRELGMRSKADHAITKITEGLCDPLLTEAVIGRIGTRDALPHHLRVVN